MLRRGEKRKVKQRANFKDVAYYMDCLSNYGTDSSISKQIIRAALKTCEPIKTLSNIIYGRVYYKPDSNNHQTLRTIDALWRDRNGNCTDYSISISTLLRILKVDHCFRFVTFDEHKRPQHVFIVLDNGTPIDLCLGQNQKGETPTTRKNNICQFGQSAKYKYFKDLKIKTK